MNQPLVQCGIIATSNTDSSHPGSRYQKVIRSPGLVASPVKCGLRLTFSIFSVFSIRGRVLSQFSKESGSLYQI